MNSRSSGTANYKNSNLNSVLSKQNGTSSTQNNTKQYANGLVPLGAPKRSRTTAGPAAARLAVPRPVNLPSLRKENAGNDPSTQIVPSGGGGSWQKPEEQPAQAAQQQTSALTAGSNWATPSALRGDGSSAPWHPPDLAFPVTPSLPPGDRRLNPREYPSLASAAASKPSGVRQPVPSVPDTSGQRTGKWDEDERQVPSSALTRTASNDWGPLTEREPNRFGDEDRWVPGAGARGHSSRAPARFDSRVSLDRPSYDRFALDTDYVGYGAAMDDSILYPPIRSAQPPVQEEKEDSDQKAAEEARKAYERELDGILEEKMLKDKQLKEEREAKAAEEAAAIAAAAATAAKTEAGETADGVREPPQTAAMAVTGGTVAATNDSTSEGKLESVADARARAALARKQREEEEERKRKEAAAAKLRELEENIKRREEAAKRLQEEAAAKAAAEEEAARAAAEEEARATAEAEEKAKAAAAEEAAARAGEASGRSSFDELSEPDYGEAVKKHAALVHQGPSSTEGTEVEESWQGSVDVRVTDSVAQDALTTSDDDSVLEVNSGGRSLRNPALAVSEAAHLGQQQVAAWDSPLVPSLQNGAITSAPLHPSILEHTINDMGGDLFTVGEALADEVLADNPKPPAASVQANVSVALPALMPVSVQQNQAPSVAPPKPPGTLSWRSIVTGNQEESVAPQNEIQADVQKAPDQRQPRGARTGRGRDRDKNHQKGPNARDGESNQGERAARQDSGNQRGRDGKDRGPRGGARGQRSNSETATTESDLGQADSGSRRALRQRGKPDGRSDQGVLPPSGASDAVTPALRGPRPNRRQAFPAGQDQILQPQSVAPVISQGPVADQVVITQVHASLGQANPPPVVAAPPIAVPIQDHIVPSPVTQPVLPSLAPAATPTLKEPPGLLPVQATAIHQAVAPPPLNHSGGDSTWGLPAVTHVPGVPHASGFDVWNRFTPQQSLPRDNQPILGAALDMGVVSRSVVSEGGDGSLQGIERMPGRPASAGSSGGFDMNRAKIQSDYGLGSFLAQGPHGQNLQQHTIAGIHLGPSTSSPAAPLQASHDSIGFGTYFPPTSTPHAIQKVWENSSQQQSVLQARPVSQQLAPSAIGQRPRVGPSNYNLGMTAFSSLGTVSGGSAALVAPSQQQQLPLPAPASQQVSKFAAFGNLGGGNNTASVQFPAWSGVAQPQGAFVPTGRKPDWSSQGSALGPSPTAPPPGLSISLDSYGSTTLIRPTAPPATAAPGQTVPAQAPPGLSVRAPQQLLNSSVRDGSAGQLPQSHLPSHHGRQPMVHQGPGQLELPNFNVSGMNFLAPGQISLKSEVPNGSSSTQNNLLPDDLFHVDEVKASTQSRQQPAPSPPSRGPAPSGPPTQVRRNGGPQDGGQRRARNGKGPGGRGESGRGFSSRGRGRAGPEAQPVGDGNGAARPRTFENGPSDGQAGPRAHHVDGRGGRGGRGRGDRGGRGGATKVYVAKGSNPAPGLMNGPSAVANGSAD
eukprot:jgi/Botrbrau1/17931/Bobra.50_1s0031.2